MTTEFLPVLAITISLIALIKVLDLRAETARGDKETQDTIDRIYGSDRWRKPTDTEPPPPVPKP